MPLKPGDRIERYVIDSLLGSGGMGEVYRAHDPRLKRAIALKILTSDAAPPDPNAKTSAPVSNPGARMLREAQLAASLDHPNVVAIFDVGQIEDPPELRGTTYLAMELIRGAPLRKYIGDAAVKMKVRVRWLEEIARALGAAHDAGLVHRDVKPENVMIREDGIVKVLDFGIAKRTTATIVDPTSSTEGYAVPTMTQQGAVVGTPFYMAPEQLRAEKLDGRADQFAWGVLAYELLTGKPLWSLEGGGFSLVAQILQAPPPAMDAFGAVSERLAGTVIRALAKDPAARFPTMAALVEELTGRVEGETDAKIRVSGAPEAPSVTARSPKAEPAIAPGDGAPEMQASRGARTLPSRPPAKRAGPRNARTIVIAAVGVVLLAAVGTIAMRSRPTPATAHAAVDAALATPSGECATNRACVEKHGGEPWLCRTSDHSCVALASEDCTPRFEAGDLRSDHTQWVGELYPLTGPNADDGVVNERATNLARADFAQAATALGPQAQRMALVSCDDAEHGSRAARHLVEDLGVPAIIGFKNASELLEVAGSLLRPSHTLAVATMTASPLVTQLPRAPDEPPLVWRTMYSLNDAAEATAALVEMRIEPELRAAGAERTRVALVRLNSPSALALSERLFDVLRFNGKSALDNTSDYRDVVVDPDSPASCDAAVKRLVDLAPRVVAYVGGDPIVDRVLAPLEHGWPASERTRARYVNIAVFGDSVLRMVGSERGLRRRFYGMTLPSTTPVNARFTMHYNETYGTELSRADAPSTAYDAFYLVAYAMIARGDAPSSGLDLARAIRRLVPPGTPVDVAPSGIFQALTLLGAGGSVDLNGATGALDYDLTTGDRPVDLSILCLDVDRKGRASGSVESGAVYDGRSKQITGTMSCP